MNALKKRIHSLWKIIVDPRPQSLSRIAEDTNNTWQASIGWLIIVSFGFSVALEIYTNSDAFIARVIGGTLTWTIGMLVWVFFIHYFCKAVFHKRADYYEALLYVIVSIYTLAIILLIILQMLPVANGMFSWAAYIYLFVLMTLAVRAITRLPWWKTLITMIVSTFVAMGCTITFPVFITNFSRILSSVG